MRAFVLSGGGFKGAFQAGALKALERSGIFCDSIYGVSTGAINAFGYAYGTAEKLVEFWKAIKHRTDILFPVIWKLFWMKGLYNLKPLQKKMHQYADNEESRCRAVASYVNLETGNLSYQDNSDYELFIEAVLASAAQPPIIEPINNYLADGGIREQTPLKKAIDDGANEIYVILTAPYKSKEDSWQWKFPYLFSYIARSVDIMCHEVFMEDIQTALMYNNLPNKKKVDIKIIAPEFSLYDTFDVSDTNIQFAISSGFREAMKIIEKVKNEESKKAT